MDKKKCEHNRQRNNCKDCKALGVGGTSICEHNRQRNKYKDCKGSSICEHNRIRSLCKECGGGGICEHNRIRSACSRCKPELFYKRVKRNAIRREIPFDLSLEDYKWIVDSPCLYCGETFEPMTCDRENSDYGYRWDNCQPLCDTCNKMKLDHSEEQFDQHIIKIIKHRPELVERAGLTKVGVA